MKTKWKAFAVNQVLSNYYGTAEEVYDAIMDAPSGKALHAVFDELEIIVWEPFERGDPDRVAEFILRLATDAQQTEEN